MWLFNLLWEKLTDTEALKESSGDYETAFFASVYRVVYLTGLSASDRGMLYRVYSTTAKCLIVIFVCSELWYLFSVTSSLDGIIDNINVTLIHLIAMYRYESMIKHKDIYKKLAMSMESSHFDISTPKRKKMYEFWLRNNQKYFKLLLTLGSCTLAAWYVYPLVDDLEYNLVVTVRLPFNYQTPALYPLTYAGVLVAFNYASYFVMMNDLIMQAHLMHLLCQFSILSDCFENILNDCNVDFKDLEQDMLPSNESFIQQYTEKLRNLVEQHQLIMNNTMDLRRVLSAPMLGQLAASSMLICFAAYQVTATIKDSIAKFLMSLLYLGYNMFELFIFCRWCDEIKMQSEHIREAVYCSGWEHGLTTVPGVRLRLMLVAARASRPLVLTAGGLYDLSLNSYATLVKTSYSALTVLLRVRHE